MDYLTLVALGAAIGTYSAMVGVGGGFLTVPALILLFDMPHNVAVGTSLVSVTLTGLSATVVYMRQGATDFKAAASFGLASLPGAAWGASLTSEVDQSTFFRLFALLLVAMAALIMLAPRNTFGAAPGPLALFQAILSFGPRITLVRRSYRGDYYQYNLAYGLIVSVVIGFLAGFFGISGGILEVPMLMYLFSFPTHVAVATSAPILSVAAASGTVTHVVYGEVQLYLALALGLGVLVGAQVGARLSPHMSGPTLARLLSLGMLGIGLRFLLT